MARPDQLSVRLAKLEAVLQSLGLVVGASSGDAATLEGHPASYFAVAGAAAALGENSSAPPAASSTYLGTFYYYRPASSSGQLLFCAKDSAGGYEWTVVAQASL
jgi:hypothetical protein